MNKSHFTLEDDSTDTASARSLPLTLGPLTYSERLGAIEDKLNQIISILNDMALYEEMKSWL